MPRACHGTVSYTHLDVYKRQVQLRRHDGWRTNGHDHMRVNRMPDLLIEEVAGDAGEGSDDEYGTAGAGG